MRKKLFFLNLLFLASSVAALQSCSHDAVIPDAPVISFSEQVKPVFVSNCAKSGCHDGGEFSLETYEEIRSHVTPGDARNSNVYRAMTKLWGEEAMPPDGPLSDQQINIIYAWIMQGAKNN